MDSTRRPYDRSLSKEPGLKKPRLNEGGAAPDRISNGRAGFLPRPAASNSGVGGASRAQRDRDSEAGDPVRGAYQPQLSQQPHQELVTQYRTALSELTFNSKPIITNLTIIAGESLQAAKAIAGTICSNIIEVPCEQKLPSLYLLDSIVKNIGRDYIKYFAPRLPEVFIKAYRQVDPSVHSGMRHLFGTWKGVFPLHTLQLIEKELGFTTTSNGSSTAATSRLESQAQAQRPAHSIHVNPKYLEARQRLQTTRARGAASDTSEGPASSHDDVEEVERTPSIGSGKSWSDPYAKSVQHLHHLRDQVTEPVREKHPNVSYSDSEYGSILPGRSGLGTDRVTEKLKEPGYDKPWYASSSIIAGLDQKKNSFGLNHGLESHLESDNSDSALHLKQKVASTYTNGLSGDWKNSEEEEYMWEDMNSRPTGGTSTDVLITKDHWDPDNSDRLDFDNHLQRSQIMQGIRPRDDDEALDDTISMDLSKVAPRTQLPVWSHKSKQPVGRIFSVTGKSIPGNSEGYPTGKSRQSTLGKTHSLSQLGPNNIGAPTLKYSANSMSGPTDSLTQPRQAVESVSSLKRNVLSSQNPKSKLLHNYPERNQTSSINLPTDPRRPQGRKNTGPHGQVPEDIFSAQRVQTQNLQSSSALLPPVQQKKRAPSAVQPRKNIEAPEVKSSGQIHALFPSQISGSKSRSTVGNSSPDQSNPLTIDSPGKSITSGLFDSVGKSVIPKSTSISGGFTKPISKKKVELPTGPSNAVNPTSNPVSSLLSSLVAKGLISSSSLKSDSVLSASPTKSPNQALDKVSSPPVISSKPLIHNKDEPSSSEPESPEKIKNLIGFEFRPDVIRNFHPDVINDISSESPHQCSICGLRLKLQERLDRHMEWHLLRVPEDNNKNPSRSWYSSLVDWVARIGPSEILGCSDDEMVEFSDPMVPADESQCACILCGELFEDVYSQERDEWMFKGAVYLTDPSMSNAALLIPIVHADCLTEDSVHDLGVVCYGKLEVDA